MLKQQHRVFSFHIIFPLTLLLIGLFLSYYTNLDILFSEFFYDNAAGKWWFEGSQDLWYYLFYKINKLIVVIIGIFSLLAYLLFVYKNIHQQWHRPLFAIFLTIALSPLLIALIKHYSGVYCPKQYAIFGGGIEVLNNSLHLIKPLNRIFGPSFCANNLNHCGKCFPGGHASGLFSLIIFYFVAINYFPKTSLIGKFFIFTLCITPGIFGSFYQLAKGNHFFIDNYITFCISWLVAYSCSKIIRN